MECAYGNWQERKAMRYRQPDPEVSLSTVQGFLARTLSKLDGFTPELGISYISEDVRRITIYQRLVDEKKQTKKTRRVSSSPRKPRAKVEKSNDPLPKIVAVVGRHDSGEFGNASCPHCGAEGRYITYFICDDGGKRGAMAGCIQLFPKASDRHFSLLEKAFLKDQEAKENKKKLASWWQEMIVATEKFSNQQISKEELFQVIDSAERNRQTWLNRNGYNSWNRRS